MLVLVGKTTAGKTLISQKLIAAKGFHNIVTYTTRKMRDDEIQDVTYHYINKEEFEQKINKGFFAEWIQMNTSAGVVYYGSAKKDFKNADSNTVAILTPDGVRNLREWGIPMTVIYVYANEITIGIRLRERGDNPNDALQRVEYDNGIFQDIDALADAIVFNNLEDDIDTVVNSVIKWYDALKYTE